MSLVAYADGALYADDVFLIPGMGDIEIMQHQTKITISQCKRFAFGLVGKAPFPEELVEIEIKARDSLIKFNSIQKANALNAMPCPRGAEPMILMSRNHTFVTSGGSSIMLRQDDRLPFAVGAGDFMFMFGYHLITKPVTKAKISKMYNDISEINNLVGPLTHSVRASELKPFIIK